MKIKEKFIASKTGDMGACEDGLFISNDFIAVIDGVTSKGKMSWDGHRSGFYAKELLLDALVCLNGKEDYKSVFTYLNNRLRENYNDPGFFIKNPEERLQAGIIIYSKAFRQIWSLGDCHGMINGHLIEGEKLKMDGLVSEIRSVFLDLEMLAGKTRDELVENDPSFEVILPLLKRQALLVNSGHEYGYGILDGLCADFDRVKIFEAKPGSAVILASDGYPKLADTLKESEDYLEWLRINDPLCIHEYKGDKGFTNGKASLDDRTYVSFTAE